MTLPTRYDQMFKRAQAKVLSPRQAIKCKCLECNCWVYQEAVKCQSKHCPLWAYKEEVFKLESEDGEEILDY